MREPEEEGCVWNWEEWGRGELKSPSNVWEKRCRQNLKASLGYMMLYLKKHTKWVLKNNIQ